MDWDNQVKTMNHALRFGASRQRAVLIVNQSVVECPVQPRVLGFLWRPRRHHYEDYTSAISTFTYTTLDRCRDCGHLVLGNGL